MRVVVKAVAEKILAGYSCTFCKVYKQFVLHLLSHLYMYEQEGCMHGICHCEEVSASHVALFLAILHCSNSRLL